MNAVFRHELKRYFVSPAGYAFLILYTLMAGVIYAFVNIGQESSASMNLTLSGMQLPLMLAAPLLTMRLFAEERRMRTDQLLLTAPVPLGRVVLGKMLAAAAMLALAMGLTVLFPLVISRWTVLSFAQVAAVYLGYYLLGIAMLSVGVWISSLCTNQITAAMATLGANLIIYLCEHYAVPQLRTTPLAFLNRALAFLPSSSRLGDFAQGIISLADVVYFLTFTALMLFYTCRVLTHRRMMKG